MAESTLAAALMRFAATGEAPQPVSAAAASALATQAHVHGLAGLLHERVHADGAWPADTRARLLAWQRAALWRGVRQLDLLERARGLLAERDIRSLPLKGAAVAEHLYRSVAERPMADVDLLALDDAPRALNVLLAAGFTLLENADHAAALLDASSGEVLELHHAPASCPRLHPLDAAGLWQRSVRGSGQVGRRPGPEDLLVLLAQHAAFQHGFVLTLVQWLDIARLLSSHVLDIPRLLACARLARAERALAGTLSVAARLVAAPVPPALVAHGRTVLAGSLRAWLERRLATPLACVVPARPHLASVRWMLVPGQRRLLLSETLRWGAGTSTTGAWRRLPALARRAARLAWRD